MSGSSFWKGGGKRKGHAHPVSSIVPIWHGRCQLDDKGNPISNLFNACIALRSDPAWAGKLRYDQMLCSVVLADTPVEDIDAFLIHEWLQDNGLRRIGLDPVREAIEIVGHEQPFHPLRDRLDGLADAWDQKDRISEWLTTYLGAVNDEYHKQVGRRFLIAMIARVYEPGCKADYMPVLEGPQGILKSQVVNALAHPYYSDTLPELGGDAVRLSMHLRGKWLIEVSELSAFSRAESSRLKAFITTRVEQYTPKFARREVSEPRQCLFVGTTNDDTYLKDETGNRRYWPIKCGTIKLEELRSELNQLLGEAVVAYRAGSPWWVDPDVEKEYFAPVQAERLWIDAWEAKVRETSFNKKEMSLMEVAQSALSFEAARFGVGEQRRLAALLRQLGWTSKRTETIRLWERPS